MRPGRLILLGVAFAATILLAADASGAASARLIYMRGPGAERCPGEQAVRAAVSTRLGYDPFFAWSRDTLFVGITHEGTTFHLEIKLVDDANRQRGSRDMIAKGDACAGVIDALGLTISLVIDPSSVLGLKPAGPADASSSAAGSPTPPDDRSAEDAAPRHPTEDKQLPLPAARPSSPLFAHIGIGMIGSLGSSPAAALGGTLLLGLRWRMLTTDLEGRVDVPSTGTSDLAGVSARSWLVVGSIVPCVHWKLAYGCPLASLGALGATSRGLPVTSDKYVPWLAVGARAGAEVALSTTLAVRLYGELLRTLTQYKLQVDSEQLYRFGPWSGALGGALVLRVL